MIWFAMVIPLIVCGILFFLYRDKTCWWEYLIVVAPSALFILLMRIAMVSYNTSDTEYLGHYITHVQHYDHWDEWIQRTCSYETCTGTGKDQVCTTHYYDCSYRQDHPERWVKVASNGEEIEISHKEYARLAAKFGTAEEFVEMSRDYYRIDGDAQRYSYNGEVQRVEVITTEHSYENRVKASSSVFKFQELKDFSNVREYPTVDMHSQSTLIGVKVKPSTQQKIDYINGVMGKQFEVRLFIILYFNKPASVVNEQLSYWQGGNKNELLVHIGIDPDTRKIQWYDATSWMDKPECTTRIKSFLSGQDKLCTDALADFLLITIPQHWHRKNFHDFDYLDIELSPKQLSWIIILLIALNTAIGIWAVKNQFT